MPTLAVTVSQFQNAYAALNGNRTPVVSRQKCVKMAMSVGNHHFTRAFGRTTTALSLASYRALAVRCVLDFTGPAVQLRPEYGRLESTEKVNLSYWIGMTFAAIAADDVLGIPRLIHAQRQHGLRKVNPASRSLADLVGQDPNQAWHVIEAKGRQTQPTAKSRGDWKAQARTVASINGAPVATGSYCVGLLQSPCLVEMSDPAARRRPSPIDLRVNSDELWDEYYRPFVDFLKRDIHKVARGGRTFVFRVSGYDPIDDDYVYVGLEEVYLQGPYVSAPFFVSEFDDQSFHVGKDGIAVATSSDPCNLK